MKWFKFYGQDYLTDSKLMDFNCVERLLWVYVLCIANAEDKKGIIPQLTESKLFKYAGIYLEKDKKMGNGILKKFVDNKMLKMITDDDNDDNKYLVINWQKLQNKNLSGYERVKKYRAKKASIDNKNTNKDDNTNDNISDNANDNPRLDKTRIDKKRIEDNNTSADPGKPVEVKTDTNYFLALFKPINPSFERLYANKTQREAINRLLAKMGADKLEQAISVLPQIINQPYAPQITTPYELEQKLGKLLAFMNQEKNKSSKYQIGGL